MPLTILLAMFVSERLPMSEGQLAVAVNRGRNAVGRHLHDLSRRGLVFRTRRVGGWDLTPLAQQLPLPFLLNPATLEINGRSREPHLSTISLHQNSAITQVIHRNLPVIHRENEIIHRENTPLHQNSATMHQNSATMHQNSANNALYIIDRQTDRQIDSNSIDVSNYPPHPVSIAMLRRMGIDGNLELMAWGMPSELIAAWWMCQWGKRPRAVLAKHLLTHRPIDPLYVRLAEWRMVADALDVEALIALIGAEKRPFMRQLPDGVDLEMFDVAVRVYGDMNDLPMWSD